MRRKFYEILFELRFDRDLSQKEIAEYLGITRSSYGMYENGVREPNISTLIKIADYFNVSLDYLLGRTDDQY